MLATCGNTGTAADGVEPSDPEVGPDRYLGILDRLAAQGGPLPPQGEYRDDGTYEDVAFRVNERAITGYRRYAVAMPKFVTIGYGDRQGYDRTPAPIREAAHARDAELQKAGAVMGIAGKPVQVRNAEGSGTATAQGPFMSSPLPVAGFAIVDASSLDEAIKMVSGCPCAVAHGVIEVWPLET